MPYIVIDADRCKGCGLCTIGCPRKLVSLSETPNAMGYTVAVFSNQDQCTACCLCAEICPDLAISVFKEDKA